MKYYRGDASENFELVEFMNSRYGFPALFFTNNKKLAERFARFHSKNKTNKSGFIYEIDFNQKVKEIDFEMQISHSSKFRKLIYSLKEINIPAALIYNVVDYPSEEFKNYSLSEILVVFDLNLIKSSIRKVTE